MNPNSIDPKFLTYLHLIGDEDSVEESLLHELYCHRMESEIPHTRSLKTLETTGLAKMCSKSKKYTLTQKGAAVVKNSNKPWA